MTEWAQMRYLPVLCLAGLLAADVVRGQDLTTYHTVTNSDEFDIDWEAFYRTAERMTLETRERLPHELDIAYGGHPKQRLDVYLPASKPSAAPVLVFLHGGGNREGDRLQYGYVAEPFAKNGLITVVASYRLQPEFPWPAQLDDAQEILAWVYRNIEPLGGSPARIFVAGHSAGSRLSAILAYRDDWLVARSLPRDLIKGAALISGISSVPNAEEMPDAALRDEANVMQRIVNPPPRNVIAVGSLETEGGGSGQRLALSEQVAANLRAEGAGVNFLIPDGHDHATLVLSLGDERSELFRAILKMTTE